MRWQRLRGAISGDVAVGAVGTDPLHRDHERRTALSRATHSRSPRNRNSSVNHFRSFSRRLCVRCIRIRRSHQSFSLEITVSDPMPRPYTRLVLKRGRTRHLRIRCWSSPGSSCNWHAAHHSIAPIIRRFPAERLPITFIFINIAFFGAIAAGPSAGWNR